MTTPASTGRDGRSRRRPGVDEQRRILTQAATRLFVERGVAAVSISQVCAVAGVSRPTFYRCFEDKEALVAHIYQIAVSTHIQVNLAAVLQEGQTATETQRELDAMIERILERPQMAAFLFQESADDTSPAYAIINATFEEATTRIESWYRERSVSPPARIAVKATMAACQWIVHDAIRKGATSEARADAKQAMWELVRAVFAFRYDVVRQ